MGDYGYDLAHEDIPGMERHGRADPEPVRPAQPPGGPAPDTDLAYDEAHDF